MFIHILQRYCLPYQKRFQRPKINEMIPSLSKYEFNRKLYSTEFVCIIKPDTQNRSSIVLIKRYYKMKYITQINIP